MVSQTVRPLPGLILLLAALISGVSDRDTLRAEEPVIPFLDALRSREYYDTALFYVEQQKQRPNLDPQLAIRLEYEHAALLLESASQIRNPDGRQQRLNLAAKALRDFVAAHPDHPQVGEANRELAKVHLNNARVALWESSTENDEKDREDLRKRARDEIGLAREIFRKALPQLTIEFGKFPPHIDPEENEQQYREKKQLEESIINSRLELAKCTYEEAQSYPEGAAEFRERLTQAIDEFELLHFEFRNQTGGHYARLWQGKCYEEMGELTKALGIYTQILSQPQSSPAVERLQDQAEEFRLICLNHPDKADYEQVIQAANYWINNSRKRRYTSAGLGILWQRAIAYEKFALTMKEGTQQRHNLRQALNDAEEVQRFPGRHKGKATEMARRLSQQMRGEESLPDDFAGALDRAQQLMNQLSDIKSEFDEAKRENETGLDRQQVAYEEHIARTDDALRLADDLRSSQAEPEQLAQLFYYRAYIDYLRENSYSAAVRAEHVAHQFAAVDSEMAERAALLSVASFAQALNNSTGAARAANIRMMEQAARHAVKVWPTSDLTANCCQLLGQALSEQKQFEQAAEWYFRTPPGSVREDHHRVLGGQALWQGYLHSRRSNGGDAPTAEEEQLSLAAQTAIQEGVESLGRFTSAPPLELITGKATLAEIYSRQNQDERAIELLTSDPASVTGAIRESLEGEGNLPLSDKFAFSVYRLLLKAYVGVRDVEQALATMERVEELGQRNPQSSTMNIYVQLGKELERELNDKQAAGETEAVADIRTNFEQFLEGLYDRKDGQSFSSLLWIAETYKSLATTLPQGRSNEAMEFFHRSRNAYEAILERDRTESEFITGEQEIGVKLRLAGALGNLFKFDAALKLMQDVVTANPNSLVAQYAAAELLQRQGMRTDKNSETALQQAIQGTDLYWGWLNIARRLQQMKTTGKLDEELTDQYYEARLNSALCRQQLAQLKSDSGERQKLLASAEQEIVTLFSVSGSVPDEWYLKFNKLYSALRVAQQKPAGTIAERLNLADAPASPDATPTETSPAVNQVAANNNDNPDEESSLSPELIMGLVLALGLTLFLVILFLGSRNSSRRRKRSRKYQSGPQETPQLPNASSRSKTGRARSTRPPAGEAPRTSPASSRAVSKSRTSKRRSSSDS